MRVCSPPQQAEGYGPDQRADYDPRLEDATKDVVFIEPVHRAGETLEVYGTMEARQFVDRWELSTFSPQGFNPYDLGRARAAFAPAALVQNSPEAERLVSAARATRVARLGRIRELAERARALVAPGRRYAGSAEFFQFGSSPAELVFGAAPASRQPPGEPAADHTLAPTPGSCPVTATLSAAWPRALKEPPGARRLAGKLTWRAQGYEAAVQEAPPSLELLSADEGVPYVFDLQGRFENGSLTLNHFKYSHNSL